MKPKKRYHTGDGWGRGSYDIPALAVAGSSDTGTWSDSPCPSGEVSKELKGIMNALKKEGLHPKELGATRSGNVFMGKRWVGVPEKEWKKAMLKSKIYLKKHGEDISFIHDALT